jgi:hypothetical protein
MEVLLGVARKTLSTYVNHILPDVIDDTFAAEGTRHVLPEDDVVRSGRRAHIENTPASPPASEGHNQGRRKPHASFHRAPVPTLRVCVNAERPCGWAWFLYGVQRVG